MWMGVDVVSGSFILVLLCVSSIFFSPSVSSRWAGFGLSSSGEVCSYKHGSTITPRPGFGLLKS